MMNSLTYKRIIILGSPGSGKTTLAKKMAERTNLPLFSMDELYWQANWQRPDERVFLQKLQAVLAQPAWILEGNYYRYLSARLPYTDAAIIVCTPTLICLWQAFKRFLLRQKQTDQTFHYAIAFRLIKNMLSFSKKTLPNMIHELQHANIPIIEYKKKRGDFPYAF